MIGRLGMLGLVLGCAVGCVGDKPTAIVEVDRTGHWLDRPYPSDELLEADGSVDLSIFPEAPTALGKTLVGGWARQADEATRGFSPLAGIYFRLDGPLDVEANYPGDASDPIRLFSLDSGDQVPIEVSVMEDAQGDPYLADFTLLMAPDPRKPLLSGERYVAMVSKKLVKPAQGWERPEGVPRDAAVATVFTVQDSLRDLQVLGAATDAALDASPEWIEPTTLRRVVALRYAQGQTPSGEPATVSTVTFEDGSTEETYLDDMPGADPVELTLDESWPMEVWQTSIQTVAFQDPEAKPWASPGVGLLLDFERSGDGWITFDADGELENTGMAESMRVVIQVPRGEGPFSVMTWDHGTGGHAYSAVQRVSTGDDGRSVAEALAGGQTVVVSRDQPLYGTRYPLIDEGFSGSLGFYNIGNLPAFRDNQRQAAVDHRVLARFCREALPAIVDEVDADRMGAFGHSLGSVTAHLGLAMAQGDGASKALMSGTGGYYTYYVLGTGLLGTDNDVVAQIGPLVGMDVTDAQAHELVAALVGLPEIAWSNMDRMHPVMGIFQLIMDPSDPLALARHQVVPETIVLGIGDLQVPNDTTWWLHEALPDSTVVECQPQEDYDGHYCTYREPAGLDAMGAFAQGL